MKSALDKFKKLTDTLAQKTRMGKCALLCAALLALGLILLAVSSLPTAKPAAKSVTAASTQSSSEDYAATLEERLASIISAIDGAGRVKVMVTLESGSEDVYLRDNDYGENIDPSGKSSRESKDKYVIVDGTGEEKGIVVRVREPEIRGVAVVCEGAGSQTVQQQIVRTVTALLGISSAQVSVAKMN